MRLGSDLALAHRLADAAGAAIRPFFRQPGGVERKADRSPVTAADRAAEAAMRAILDKDRPGDAVLGEEMGLRAGARDRLWVLDPIDGTRAFLAGRPLFGVLIALMIEGRPILGLIDQPIAGDRWVGRLDHEPGTMLNGRPVRSRACPSLAQAHAATTSPGLFSASGFAGFQRLAGCVGDLIFGGDCHNYGLVAAGHLDLVIEEGLQLHDWAALVPVVEGAGGRITDWQGRTLDLGSSGDVLAVGDPRLTEAALARL